MADASTEISDVGHADVMAAQESAARAVLAVDPDDIEAHRWLARFLYERSRLVEAAPHLRVLAKAEPDSPKIRRRLAHCLEAAGDELAALGIWREMLQYDLEDLDGHCTAVRLSRRIDQHVTSRLLKAVSRIRPEQVDKLRAMAKRLERVPPMAISLWNTVLKLAPGDKEAHSQLARLLVGAGLAEEAAQHLRALGGSEDSDDGVSTPIMSPTSDHFLFMQDGKARKAPYAYFRGETTNVHPTDDSLARDSFIKRYIAKGLMPSEPLFDAETSIVAFGSCFAAHISDYLLHLGYRLGSQSAPKAYVSVMGDGIVNTHAIRQQFEWAWEARQPAVDLWHGYDAKTLGYDEEVRLETRRMFDEGDAFIITLGLSEVWYDEPTGEVFWRAVPKEHFDPARHKFRVTTHAENLENIKAIHRLIRRHRPHARIILSLSPIALAATFRPIAAIAADSASKAILRSAVDEFMREAQAADPDLYYFPSYEIAQRCFAAPYAEDRKHVHRHVLEFNMAVFERYFCKTGMTDETLLDLFRQAQALDRKVIEQGHFAVERRTGRMTLTRDKAAIV